MIELLFNDVFASTLCFIILGYLSGSLLFAKIFASLFGKHNIYENSPDKNPGTANAFTYGGFLVGVLTLIFDLAKGFLPVFLYISYCKYSKPFSFALSLVIAAPVIGHIFPAFFRFRGGKGIAAAFGALMGLWPFMTPLALLAGCYLVLTLVARIDTHLWRSVAAFVAFAILMYGICPATSLRRGGLLISTVVVIRHLCRYQGDAFAIGIPILRRLKRRG